MRATRRGQWRAQAGWQQRVADRADCRPGATTSRPLGGYEPPTKRLESQISRPQGVPLKKFQNSVAKDATRTDSILTAFRCVARGCGGPAPTA